MAFDGLLQSDEEVDLLTFVLDSTIEQWKTDESSQLDLFAQDPAYSSAEALLEACGSFVEMTNMLQRIRDRIVRVG